MQELARVTLGNEMDLILAHKRSMKLAELACLSLSAQTTFATAVSEVARNTIENGKSGCLVLNIDSDHKEKYIVACLNDESNGEISKEGLEYAKRLVNKYNVSKKGIETSIELFYHVNPPFKIDIYKVDEWRNIFRNEPAISPYEELKRKNEQLQDLSEKLQKSEGEYKTLTNTIPLIIFSIDTSGDVIYANEWLTILSGATVKSLNQNKWRSIIHPDDYASFLLLLQNDIAKIKTGLKLQCRFKNIATGNYLWHQVSLTPFNKDEDETHYWIGYIVDIDAQKNLEETLKDNIELKLTKEQLQKSQFEQEKFIEELNRSNYELQQFAFIASHDLQEPVRKLLYYSDYLINRYAETLSGKGIDFLYNMQQSAQRMRTLIKDLLVFSQIKKEEVVFTPIDLNKIAAHTLQDFEILIEEKNASLTIDPLPIINADERMMLQLFENLISNSLKYSKAEVPPIITIKCLKKDDTVEIAFKDNGIGFNENYLSQMFTLFQRLHNRSDFEGTGLGLAICKKIIELHKGKIWATSSEGNGATFYISLPV